MDEGPITVLLEAARAGDRQATDELFSAVYNELKKLARAHRGRWRGNETLNTTALIHEAFIKLAGQEDAGFANRTHFFATASKAMRQILVNYAERQDAAKRGGDVVKVPLDENLLVTQATAQELLSLHELLTRLEALCLEQPEITAGDAAREADAAVDIMAQFDTPFMMRVVEADQAYARGVELARAQTRVAHLGEALTWLGLARLENGDPAGADQSLEDGLELLESFHVEATPAKAEAIVGLGRVALANGEPDAALTYLEDADRFWAAFDPENRAAGIAAFWLGRAQAALDLPDEAEASFERAKRLLAQSPLPADNVLLQRIDAS